MEQFCMLKNFSVLVLLLHTLCNSMDMRTSINALHRSQETFPFSADSESSSLRSSCELVRPVSPFPKSDSLPKFIAAIRLFNNLCITQSILPLDQSQTNDAIDFSQINELLQNKESCCFLLGKCDENKVALSIIMQSLIRSDNLAIFKLAYGLQNSQYNVNDLLLSACYFGSHQIVDYCITELGADVYYCSKAHVNNAYAFGSCFRVTAATPLWSTLQGKYNKQNDEIIYDIIISSLNDIAPISNKDSGIYFLEHTPISINELADYFTLQESLENDNINIFEAIFVKHIKIKQNINQLIGIASGLGALNIVRYLLNNPNVNINYWCARPEDIRMNKNAPYTTKYYIRKSTALDQALRGQAMNPENTNYAEIIRLLRQSGASDEATGVVSMLGPLLPLDDYSPSKRIWGER